MLPRVLITMILCLLAAVPSGADSGVRARDLGIPFDGTPGPLNAITDVPGVEVGYATLVSGSAAEDGPVIRTGVTVVLPRGKTPRPYRAVTGAGGEVAERAVSTAPVESGGEGHEVWHAVTKRGLDPVFKATVEATEEAIVNVLVAAETMTGIHGHRLHALPHDRLREVMKAYGR